MRIPTARVCVLLFAVGACALTAAAQTTGPPPHPPLAIRSLTGGDLFEFYCATCHGHDGRGNGPVVAALKAPPPDLTQISRRHGGTFPRDRVERFVTNDGGVLAPAHGTSAMPVWGPIFRSLDPTDLMVKVRIANVVAHVESIQAKP
jgi:mono/diheme cytochrome c family protein